MIQLTPTTSPVRFTILLLALLLVVTRGTAAQSRVTTRPSFSLDDCRSTSDCAFKLECHGIVNRSVVECRPKVERCICLPVVFRYCKKSKACRKGEGCATNPRSGNDLCVSCNLINDKDRNYTNADPDSKNCSPDYLAPEPSPSPPPVRRTFDYCSMRVPCSSDLTCYETDLSNPSSPMRCSRGSPVCNCRPAKPRTCTAHDQCPSGEACALFVTDRINICVSCSVARQSVLFAPLGSTQNAPVPPRCDKSPSLKSPSFAPARSGHSLDECTNDSMCVKPRRCLIPKVGGVRVQCKPNAFATCYCLKPQLDVCSNSRSCRSPYELCAQLNIAEERNCLSRSFLSSLPRLDFQVFGRRASPPRPTRGNIGTGSRCRMDSGCAFGRRCTHVTERFGECAGRRACTCEPLFRKRCTSTKNCTGPDEECVRTVGSRGWPFCLARIAMRKLPLVRPIASNKDFSQRIDAPPLLNGDHCRQHSDCQGARKCQHVTEVGGECAGRDGCVCRSDNARCKSSTYCADGEECTMIKDSFDLQGECRSTRSFGRDKTGSLERFQPRRLSSKRRRTGTPTALFPSPETSM